MHKVKRAIIMAAGTGSRMRPVTLETPKPLVKVNGTRMIDTAIEGRQAQGHGSGQRNRNQFLKHNSGSPFGL